jgi:hypothetical protein
MYKLHLSLAISTSETQQQAKKVTTCWAMQQGCKHFENNIQAYPCAYTNGGCNFITWGSNSV